MTLQFGCARLLTMLVIREQSACSFLKIFLTYIYLSKHKYNKTCKVPHKTTQDEKYVHKGLKKNRTNRN